MGAFRPPLNVPKSKKKPNWYAIAYRFLSKILVLSKMEDKEKEYIKLRFALSFKKILDENKAKRVENKKKGIKDRNLIDSYTKWETASGVPKATLLAITQGRKNAAGTTLIVLLEALEISLSDFAGYFEGLTEKEVWAYKAFLQRAKDERTKPKRVKKNRL
jgi:hypothetical protein